MKVLGPVLGGSERVFAAGLRRAVEIGRHVCTLSLGTTEMNHYARFHELAHVRNVILAAAAENMPIPSFRSAYDSVISVDTYGIYGPALLRN